MDWRPCCAVLHLAEKRFPCSSPGHEASEYEWACANPNQSGIEWDIRRRECYKLTAKLIGEKTGKIPIKLKGLDKNFFFIGAAD